MLNIRYFDKWPNFGDSLSPIIVTLIAGCPVSNDPARPGLLAAGSILHSLAQSGDVVWGSGLWVPTIKPGLKLDVRAVRGPLTRQILLASGIDCPPVYGDPAILLPRLYRPPRIGGGGVRVLPHGKDVWLKERAAGDCDLVLDVAEPSLRVVDKIVESDVLVTSSLHGLVVAESYGVPVALVRSKAQFTSEPAFKFADYFNSTGRDAYVLLDTPINEAAEFARTAPKPTFNPEPLLAAFPHDLKDAYHLSHHGAAA